jgi:hypothetical protein
MAAAGLTAGYIAHQVNERRRPEPVRRARAARRTRRRRAADRGFSQLARLVALLAPSLGRMIPALVRAGLGGAVPADEPAQATVPAEPRYSACPSPAPHNHA